VILKLIKVLKCRQSFGTPEKFWGGGRTARGQLAEVLCVTKEGNLSGQNGTVNLQILSVVRLYLKSPYDFGRRRKRSGRRKVGGGMGISPREFSCGKTKNAYDVFEDQERSMGGKRGVLFRHLAQGGGGGV